MTRPVRILMMGERRVPNLVLCLLFDCFLPEFEITYVVSPCDPGPIQNLLMAYGINQTNVKFVADAELEQDYPDIKHWKIPGDPRYTWLPQQAIKLAMIDRCQARHILLQDVDSFCLQPYSPFINDQPNFFYEPDHQWFHSSGYYQAFENATGLKISHRDSFCCDMLPVDRGVFEAFKHHVTHHTGQPWLQALIYSTPLQWDKIGRVRWFSEYETLANWHLSQGHGFTVTQQHRAEFIDVNYLGAKPREANFVSDKTPPGKGMHIDLTTGKVFGMDQVLAWLAQDNFHHQ